MKSPLAGSVVSGGIHLSQNTSVLHEKVTQRMRRSIAQSGRQTAELIALYPLHLTPFPEALSDSADDVDMEVDGPAAPASFAEFEAGGSPGV
jgi:hypothetical protein